LLDWSNLLGSCLVGRREGGLPQKTLVLPLKLRGGGMLPMVPHDVPGCGRTAGVGSTVAGLMAELALELLLLPLC
jgi:hypothetical protein